MREYVAALRAIWRCWEDGEPLGFRGEHYRVDLMTPNFSPAAHGHRPIPITLAAVGTGMLRVAAEVADGVQLHPFCTRAYLDRIVAPEIEAGLARSGRSRESFHVNGGGFLATGPDSDTVQRIAEFIRYRIAFYGSTRTYWPVFEVHDLLDLGAKLHDLSKRGRWDEMAAQISDEVLHLFAVVGTHRELPKLVAERFAGHVDQVMAMPAPDADPALPAEVIEALQTIPTPFSAFPGR